jgi:metallo-beta-lactamase family protein
MKLQFLGADRQVTGSCYHLQASGLRLIVDCGLFQEREYLGRNWEPFVFDPGALDFVLLTHAHLDHSGLLPKLVREGFQGRILATAVTKELLPIVLQDSGHLQEEDAAFKKKRHAREGRRGPYPEIPLYTVEDALAVSSFVQDVPYLQRLELDSRLSLTFHDAGHILGSAMAELRFKEAGGERRLIFSGDVGQWDRPIVRNPSVFDQADYVVLESTYGDSRHQDPKHVEDILCDIIGQAVREGGNVVVPTFALERAQEILFYLSRLTAAQCLPRVSTFLDSPMAAQVTEVFEKNIDFMDRQTQALFRSGYHPFRFPGLHLVQSIEESKAINSIKGSCIILAGSGMCTGGRIKHHLTRNISRPESIILFVGYQARGTLGRQIIEGQPKVRIHGQYYPVRAKIVQIQGLSAHADQQDLLRWLRYLRAEPREIFLTHGDQDKAEALAGLVANELGWRTRIPGYKEEVELNGIKGGQNA